MVARDDYRADVDGLRAVAVLSVMIYHYNGTNLLPGGFVGVDVFFVISGYLITLRLAAEIGAGTFSVLAFYDRRLRRIMPALLAMLAATLLLGRFLLIPGDYQSLAGSTGAAALGVSNFFFLAHTGYFDQAAALMPLLHTWSLAVEEQFYLVWPFLLFLLAAGRSRLDVAAAVAALAIVGFGVGLVWHDLDSKGAFFMALPRAWELLAGAALVFLPRLPVRIGEAAAALGLAAIAASLISLPWEGTPAALLLPCIGSALILWPRGGPTIAARWLGWLAPIGLISYSLYLWHWPVWVLFRIYINNAMPGPRETATLAAVAILISALSYRYIEQPFRKPRLEPAKTVWAAIAAATCLFCSAMYVNSSEGLPQRMARDAYAMRSLAAMWEWRPCEPTLISSSLRVSCLFGANWQDASSKAVLWGESNAAHLVPMLDEVARSQHVPVALYAHCSAILGGREVRDSRKETPDYNMRCAESRAALLGFLSKDPSVKTVILSASWQAHTWYLTSTSGKRDRLSLLELGLNEILDELIAMGKQVTVVVTVPQWLNDPLPCAMLDIGLLRRPCGPSDGQLSKTYYEQSHAETLEIFRRLAEHRPEVQFIFPGNGLCHGDACVTRIRGEFIYRDQAHLRRNLTPETNRELARLIGLDRIFTRAPEPPR
ncbi:MAG: putative acyltransferase [Bradyrhizobium sp.]|nr:putative acyltransferase [Bradyrhizobium sp.]